MDIESPLKKIKREQYQVCKKAYDGVINDLKSIENPDPQTQVDINNTALYALRLEREKFISEKRQQQQQQQQQLWDECLQEQQEEQELALEQLEYRENCTHEGVDNESEQQLIFCKPPRNRSSFPPIHKASFWKDKSCKDYSRIRSTLKEYSYVELQIKPLTLY